MAASFLIVRKEQHSPEEAEVCKTNIQLQDEHKPNVTWEFLIYLAVLIDIIVLTLGGLDLTFSLIT